MNDIRRFAFLAVTAMIAVVLPCLAQEGQEATPTISGTGVAGHVAGWKNSTTLTSSSIYAKGGNVGIGTDSPAATLEVNGNAQVDGNFSLSGSILETGVGQLLWAPNDGSGNFSAGIEALPSTTTGTDNTALGDDALKLNTTGIWDTASGYEASYSNTTGYSNTATGYRALYSNSTGFNNTATGSTTLYYNSTGPQNTAVGVSALHANTTGGGNTAVGLGALDGNSTGSLNIGIGIYSGLLVTGSGNIDIGNAGTSSDNGVIRIGCSSSNNCTTSPAFPQTSTFIAGIYGATTSLNSTMPVIIDANGNLGTVQSSRRFKEDIQKMGDASDGLMHLRPVTFRYKKAYDDGSKPVQYGLIAEEVADVYPDLVARSADGQVESVRYQLLDPMLLNELQKQHATIDAQKEQIRSLEERLARVEAMLTAGATGATRQ